MALYVSEVKYSLCARAETVFALQRRPGLALLLSQDLQLGHRQHSQTK